MRARILSPIQEANQVVGVLWMDCDFGDKPKVHDSVKFVFQEKNSFLLKVIPAGIDISPKEIDLVLVTGMLEFDAGPLNAGHSANLIRQGWRREVEANSNWPATKDLGQWMAEVSLCNPNWMASWARAVSGIRNGNVCRCNHAELLNGRWLISADILSQAD